MSDRNAIARLSALTLVGLLALSLLLLGALSFGLFSLSSGSLTTSSGARTVRAELADAWPLVAGMDVRINGGVAGTVQGISLTKRGTALVTMTIDQGLPAPTADASVAIQQQDVLGDTYVDLSLGTSPSPLRGPIPIARSIQEPRLDDVLDTFSAPVRAALTTVIDELGLALERRGVDLNAAILEIEPAFQATSALIGELRGQNTALAQALSNSHVLTSQLAARTHALGGLIDGLSATTSTVAEHDPALGSVLAHLPATITAAHSTLNRLQAVAGNVLPLARTFGAGAPAFTQAARDLPSFAASVTHAVPALDPTLRLVAADFRRAAPAIGFAAQLNPSLAGPTLLLLQQLGPFVNSVVGSLFGSSTGGGLGSAFVPGNDLTEPNVDPARDWLAIYYEPSCELFGQPIAPGCLQKALTDDPLGLPVALRRSGAPAVHAAPRSSPPAAAPIPTAPAPTSPTAAAGSPPLLAPLASTTGALDGVVKRLLGQVAGAVTAPAPPHGGLGSLLHYLTGP